MPLPALCPPHPLLPLPPGGWADRRATPCPALTSQGETGCPCSVGPSGAAQAWCHGGAWPWAVLQAKVPHLPWPICPGSSQMVLVGPCRATSHLIGDEISGVEGC